MNISKMIFKAYKFVLNKFIKSIKENEDPIKYIYSINIRKLHHIYSNFRYLIFSPIINSFYFLCKIRSNSIFYNKRFNGNLGKEPIFGLGIRSVYKKLYMKKSQKPSKLKTLINKLNGLKQSKIEKNNDLKIFANVLVISSFLSVLVYCLPFSSIVGVIIKKSMLANLIINLKLGNKTYWSVASTKSIISKLMYFFNTYVLFSSAKKKTSVKPLLIVCLAKKLSLINT